MQRPMSRIVVPMRAATVASTSWLGYMAQAHWRDDDLADICPRRADLHLGVEPVDSPCDSQYAAMTQRFGQRLVNLMLVIENGRVAHSGPSRVLVQPRRRKRE